MSIEYDNGGLSDYIGTTKIIKDTFFLVLNTIFNIIRLYTIFSTHLRVIMRGL